MPLLPTGFIPPDDLSQTQIHVELPPGSTFEETIAVAEALIERITQSQRQRDVAARMSYGPSRPVASFIDRAL